MEIITNNIFVIASTQEKAINFLSYLVSTMNHENIVSIQKNNRQMIMSVYLKDGTTYQAASLNYSLKGYKCKKAYIEESIDKEFVQIVIMPMLCYSKEEENIIYF